MTDSYVPGDLEIADFKLEGNDYREDFVSFYFQENLFAPYVKGRVRLVGQEGFQSKFDGTKGSSITFSTPNSQKRKYSTLMTKSIGNLMTDESQRTRWMDMEFVSKHLITNNATPNYQKSVKNKQISSIVKTVFQEGLGLEIPLNVDDTRGLQGSDHQPVILTQRSPLMHLDALRQAAVSLKSDYDGFLLFSGIGESGGEEMNFKSVWSLLNSDPVFDLTNYSNHEMRSSLTGITMNNVIESWIPTQTDAMAKMSSFSSGVTKLDINTMQASYPKYEYGASRQQYGSKTSLNPGKTSGFVAEPYNGLPGTKNVITEDSRNYDSYIPETVAYTESLFRDMMQSSITVKVPGNSNLRVGQVINYDMRENTDNVENKDTKFYGKHLIVGMTHYVGPMSDRPRYVTYLDLANIETYNGAIS